MFPFHVENSHWQFFDDWFADVMISDVLSEQVLYSWQGKDIERKVIVITSILPGDVDSVMQKSLMVSVCVHDMNFVFFELCNSFLSKIS